MSRPIIVAIDGPAGAGKSSVAKAVARRLGLALVDTGAIYRCVALAAQNAGIDWADEPRLGNLLAGLQIGFCFQDGENHVLLQGTDVSQQIRTPAISAGASAVSARPVVRAGLLDLQRRLARASTKGAVLEGRDIGTVVFPDADVKIFITAADEVRANRRFLELKAKNIDLSLAQVLADQKKRDFDDSHRSVAPLCPAADAVQLDTSTMSLGQVIDHVAQLIEAKLAPGP